MREKAVCNASPLIFLSKLGRLDLLDSYSLYIPSQVESEILKGHRRHRENSDLIMRYFSENRVKRVKVAALKDLPHSLGSGEMAAISLAVKEGIGRILIDESRARTVARFKGLKPKGTLGVLWDSYKTGRMDGKTLEALALDLIQKGYRIKEDVFIEFLKKLRKTI